MGKILKQTLYTYSDITIIPTALSNIRHRIDINPFDENGFLPIFAAPMTSVVNKENVTFYEDNNIIPILPRNYDMDERIENSMNGRWSAYSLEEFENFWCDAESKVCDDCICNVLIDIANGHMKHIYDLVRKSKTIYGDKLIVMVGNVANPEVYREAALSGVDYIRCGIGGGDCCITSTITGIHYPMASLISDIVSEREKTHNSNPYIKLPKIVADGGIRGTDDVIKALSLGADYVMIGSLFGRKLESASKCLLYQVDGTTEVDGLSLLMDEKFEVLNDTNFKYDGKNVHIMKTVYGMASKMGQDAIGSKPKQEEGLVKMMHCDGTLNSWTIKMEHALRSAMSYLNCSELKEMHSNANVCLLTQNAYNAVNR